MSALDELRRKDWHKLTDLEMFIAVARQEPYETEPISKTNDSYAWLAADEYAALRARLDRAEKLLRDAGTRISHADTCVENQFYGSGLGCTCDRADLFIAIDRFLLPEEG